jgi:pimeloyl-ACP methyl ester carboxylesterase
VPFLARSFQVVVIDPRGNGRSDWPTSPSAYADRELMEDAWAVLDQLGVEQAVLVGLCSGAGHALMMAAELPRRVLGVCAINPGLALTPPHPWKLRYDFDAELDTDESWAKLNRHYWRRDWPGFARFFFAEMFPEPHSTKQREDCVAWATASTVESMLGEMGAPSGRGSDPASAAEICRAVTCPVLVISGTEDRCQPPERGRLVAEMTRGEHVVIEGGGHLPNARDPVKVNLLLRDFVERAAFTNRGAGTGGDGPNDDSGGHQGGAR